MESNAVAAAFASFEAAAYAATLAITPATITDAINTQATIVICSIFYFLLKEYNLFSDSSSLSHPALGLSGRINALHR